MSNILKTEERSIADLVGNRIQLLMQSGELTLPANYSPENAIKSAYLILSETEDRDGNKALKACSRASIINSLMNMVILGLSPAKKQCAFIMRWDGKGGERTCKLYCDVQYQGTIALAKRHAGLETFAAQVVYEKDEIEFEINSGKLSVLKHVRKPENIDNNKITGAYCVLTFNSGEVHTEYMTMPQIRQAWEQGPAKGNSPAHRNFPDQMAMKTVITRGCKLYIQSSDDSELYEDGQQSPYKEKAKAIPQDAEVVSFEEEKPKQVEAPKVFIPEPEQSEAFSYETQQPAF
jgi:recombination protein RecT